MRRLSNPWKFYIIGAVLMLSGQHASADKAADFRKHYERAMSHYDSGAYETALTEFQMAYAIKQLPKLLLNIGQLHRKLGHAKDALGYYELYLRVESNPEPQLRAELDRYIQQTRAMLDAAERVRGESVETENRAKSERQQDHSETKQGTAIPTSPPTIHSEPPHSEARSSAASSSGQTGQAPGSASHGAVSSEPQARPSLQTETQTAPKSIAPADGLAAQTQSEPPKPLYRRGWFWGVMAAVAIAGAGGITAGVLLSNRQPTIPDNIEVQSFLLRF